MTPIVIANLLSALGFSAAVAGVVAMPSRPGGFARRGIKLLAIGALSIYAFVGFSHILQYLGITTAFDIYENYLKVLFIPLASCVAYAVRMNDQLRETERHARILTAEHEMLMRVVDTTPTGVAVVDDTGRLEFANERAQAILGVAEDPNSSGYTEPRWVLTTRATQEPMRDFSFVLGPDIVRDAVCTLRWPDGRALALLVNSSPIKSAEGRVVGAVIAFTERPAAVAAG